MGIHVGQGPEDFTEKAFRLDSVLQVPFKLSPVVEPAYLATACRYGT
jgi:hypothetical protein